MDVYKAKPCQCVVSEHVSITLALFNDLSCHLPLLFQIWGEKSFSEPPPGDSSWTDSVSDAASSDDGDSRGVIGSLWDWWNES